MTEGDKSTIQTHPVEAAGLSDEDVQRLISVTYDEYEEVSKVFGGVYSELMDVFNDANMYLMQHKLDLTGWMKFRQKYEFHLMRGFCSHIQKTFHHRMSLIAEYEKNSTEISNKKRTANLDPSSSITCSKKNKLLAMKEKMDQFEDILKNTEFSSDDDENDGDHDDESHDNKEEESYVSTLN